MCMPHGSMGTKSNGFVKVDKPKKHIVKVSQEEFEKGDPNFVDERTTPYEPKKKGSYLLSLFGL